jgi:hypothetical protein
VTLTGPLEAVEGVRYVVSADLGVKHDRSVGAVAHSEPWVAEGKSGRRIVLDRIETWAGTRAQPVELAVVEEWLAQASRSFGAAPVVVDPWQAIGMAQRLRDRGITVTEFAFSQQSVGRLAATLHLLLRNRALALPDDPALIDELANVRLREVSPGVFRMDHDPDQHDDRAVALALAAYELLNNARRGPRFLGAA